MNEKNISERNKQIGKLDKPMQKDVRVLERLLSQEPWSVDTTWKEPITKVGRSGPHQHQFQQGEQTVDLGDTVKTRLVSKTVDRLIQRLEGTEAEFIMQEILKRSREQNNSTEDLSTK